MSIKINIVLFVAGLGRELRMNNTIHSGSLGKYSFGERNEQ